MNTMIQKMNNKEKPPYPERECPACKRKLFWFQEASWTWVCSVCSPDVFAPDPLNRQTFTVNHEYYKR
jgi:ribosomal protein L37AE/L43A